MYVGLYRGWVTYHVGDVSDNQILLANRKWLCTRMMGKEAVAATKYDGITGMIWMNFSHKRASNFNKMDSL